MRHGLGYRKLNKTGEHRKALFKNMLNSLIKYEQIITTLPKAKELKPQIDKVITIGKKNILSNKKRLFSKKNLLVFIFRWWPVIITIMFVEPFLQIRNLTFTQFVLYSHYKI